MSRVRRISYAITPEGRRSNAIKQAIDLRDKVLSIVDNSNFSSSTARKITKKAAFSVVMRSLEESKGLPLSLREHLAMKELNKYISLAKHNKSDFFYATNTDLLPISHPRSTREHSMTASALRVARSRWFAADPRITDERAKAVLASAFEAIPGSVEHLYYTSILLSLPQGMIPGEALIAASDGNSSASRSARARRQRRDSKGRFAYQGGGIRALIRRLNGDIFSISGRVVANAKNSRDVEVEFPDGKIAEINPAKGEYVKAVLPTPDGYSPEPITPSVTDEVINEKDLVFVDAPNGWIKDEKFEDENAVGPIERYVDSDKEFVVFINKQNDGTKNYNILNAKNAELIDDGKNWADVQDILEGKEDQFINFKSSPPSKEKITPEPLPFRRGLIPAEDRPGPNAYEKLMAEKKDKENAIANRRAELEKNADDRIDALDRTVPEGWAIEEENNALMLRRATEPADLENVYKQDNFVARVVEQGEISVKDKNNLLENKVYQNWAYVDKDKDARATEYAQRAREEIKKFAPDYGYKEEDLNKIDSMSAAEIASFFLDEKLQPEGFSRALDDYMNSAMVDAPSEQQERKWKNFGQELRIINDAGDFPSNNKKKADLPKQPDAPVKTKGGFEFNYPAGAYKIKQDSEYDIQGRVDEDSPDFTDDPIELAQKQDERDILAALEQAVSPGENGENALGVGALPFAKGDEFVPAEALFFALQEAGMDAPMELAKIYDKKLGNDNNEKALIDFRKKAETVSGNTPELAESFKKVTEQDPDLEPPTQEPKFDAKEMDLIPLPPLLEGLSEKELDQFNETKDHIPYLPKNEEIEMPAGYNPLSPEPFAAWKEVTAENPDPVLPEGFSDNPVFLAQEITTNDLLKELRRSVEPGNEVPGAAVIALPTDDGEDFVANVPGEAVRDALQLKGIDTNAELKKIVEEGFEGQVDEAPAAVAVDEPDRVVRLVVDGDVPLEKQIRDAIAAKLKVAFLYNDIERIVLPVEIFENPKNSNVNMRAIDANGDRKTFTLSKIENSKEGAPAGAPEITDKEIFDRRMAGESLQDLEDATGIPREEIRAREAKYARENPEVKPEAVVGDYKPTADQIDKLQKGIAKMDWLDEGIMFLKPDDGGPRAEAPIEIYDDNGLPEDGPFAKIDLDGNFEWRDQGAYDKYADRLKEIIDADLVGIGENQEPKEIDNVPVEQEKLDDNQESKDKTYVEENPEVIKVNAFVEANAGRLAPTKARDVKRGDFLWNNFNKVYEEILDIQPAPFGRVRFLIRDPRNQKEYFRFFDRRSPIRNMRRLGTGEVPEDFRVPSEENKGDGPKRGRALRQPLEKRVEVVAGRDVGGFAYREGFYKDKNGIVLNPGDRVRHGNKKKNDLYGEGVVVVRAGDQIDEAKKVGGIGRNGKVYKDYVWVQIPGEDGPRLWKSRMIVKQGGNAGPARIAPEVVVPEPIKLEGGNIFPEGMELNVENINKALQEFRLKLPKAKNYKGDKNLRDAGRAVDSFLEELNRNKKLDEVSDYYLNAMIRRLNRNGVEQAQVWAAEVESFKKVVNDKRDELRAARDAEYQKKLAEPMPENIWPSADSLDEANVKAVLEAVAQRLPAFDDFNASREHRQVASNIKSLIEELDNNITLSEISLDNIESAVKYLERLNSPKETEYANNLKKLQQDIIAKRLKDPVKPNTGANMQFIDPIAEGEKRSAAGENPFDSSADLRAKFASDDVYDQHTYLQPFKETLQSYFALEGAQPLAKLDPKTRQALSQYVSASLHDPNEYQGIDVPATEANGKERVALIKALHDEKKAYEPNRTDLGIGAELMDIDFDAIVKIWEKLKKNQKAKIVINNQDTEFSVKKIQRGINQTFAVIHNGSGQIFYMKRESSVERADAEVASNLLARGLGISGVPILLRHNKDKKVVISTTAGDNLNLVGSAKNYYDSSYYTSYNDSHIDKVMRLAAVYDLTGLGVLDSVIYNTDRHANNFLIGDIQLNGVPSNGYESVQLIPIDHGYADILNGVMPNAPEPYAYMETGEGKLGSRINKAFAKSVGAGIYKELIDMTVQQAIQFLQRERGGNVSDATIDLLLSRLKRLKGIEVNKWQTGLVNRR